MHISLLRMIILLFGGCLLTQVHSDVFIKKENVDPADVNLQNASGVILVNITIKTLPKNYFRDLGVDALKIRITDSQLDEIDMEAFDGLDHLNVLDLIDDEIKQINPETFSRLKGLHTLNLDSNRLNNVVLNLPTIQELILSNNLIENLPANCLTGRNIRIVDLSSNCLQYINCSFANQDLLERIDLSENDLIELDSNVFGNNTKLAYVNASGNSLSSTQGLKIASSMSLDLSKNSFTLLTSEMFEGMDNLEYLYLSENPIQTLDNPFKFLKYLLLLDLSYNEIEKIDSDLFKENYRLEKLNLQGNKIKTLNPFITELKSLFYFDISNNELNSIDKKFFKSMSRLNILDMSYNQLTDVSEIFEPLSKLQKLNLAVNNITLNQPFTMKNQDLRSINLSSNGLDLNIGYFKNNKHLSHIDLSDNGITNLCVENVQLDELIDIDLCGNQIKDLKCFKDGKFEKLNAVDIRKNPLICDSNLDDTIHWFAINVVSPDIVQDAGDDIMNMPSRTLTENETLSEWNLVKRELCPNGFDINIERVEDLKESLESDSSESVADASQEIEKDILVNGEIVKPKAPANPVNYEEIVNTEEYQTEATEEYPQEIVDFPSQNDVQPELIQSQRASWSGLQEDTYVNEVEIINDDEIKRSGYPAWYTIALVLIGVSLSLVCINVAGFMYIRSKTISKRGSIKTVQTYTQLNNDVYRNTTEPAQVHPNNIYSPNRSARIFQSDKIQELLLNFGLWRKGEEDSESVKKMIVNGSNTGLQQC